MPFHSPRRSRVLAALLPVACTLLAGQTACSSTEGSPTPVAPNHLAYGTLSATYAKGTEIMANLPRHDGGVIDHYSVAPALPPGLTLDPTTGVISGRPALSWAETTYTVIGRNRGGATSVTLRLSVADAAPAPATLAAARTFHTGTLLQDGRVLLAGGLGDRGPSASAELFDPATGAFTAIPDMVSPRMIYSAALLADGSVLLLGGFDGAAPLASAERFDPASGTFAPAPSMVSPRMYHTATTLQNGKVLITGGYADFSGPLASAELFDPAKGTFEPTGSLHRARGGQSATLLPDGRVLIAGGFDATHALMTSAELYDPAKGTFSDAGPMGTARGSQSATLLANGKVLVAGGYGADAPAVATAELFDPAMGTFSPTGSLATARASQGATRLPDGRVLLSGGDDMSGGPNSGTNVFASLELYDPATGTFNPAGTFATARTNHTDTLLPNGMVLSAGGFDVNGAASNTAELFDPAATPLHGPHAARRSAASKPLAIGTLRPRP